MEPSNGMDLARRDWKPWALLLGAAFVFDLLFWDQPIGLNLSLFAVLITAALFARYRWPGLSKPARAALVGLAVCAAMMTIHGSMIALTGTVLSLFLFTALAHEAELRSPGYALAQALLNQIISPPRITGGVASTLTGARVPSAGWRWTRLALLPSVALVVYFSIYRAANPKFDAMTAGMLDAISGWLDHLLTGIFTAHSIFLLFATLFCAGLLFRFAPNWMARRESRWNDLLVRHRLVRPHWLAPLPMNALERERRTGIILLVTLNLLLLVVNAIDINWFWFGFTVEKGISLKQFVHEGTWLLIISILLSMIILFHVFRGNQNFHPRGALLRSLALAWVAQNVILGISVFLRNYHYIAFHGLAYKRIGVVVFLVLVLIGLVTLAVKIRERRSAYYLFRVNGWAAFAMLVLLTTVDWDRTIVRYNIGHWNGGEIDIDNYLVMSDKVLPLLYADLDKVEEQMRKHQLNEVRWVEHLDPLEFRRELDVKRDRFMERWQHTGWQGWNLADSRAYEQLSVMDQQHATLR